MTEHKQTEVERGFTLLARSDQWEQFVGDAVNAKTLDRLISAGNLMHAIMLLRDLRRNHIWLDLARYIICAREAYLKQCNVEVIRALFTKEVK